MYLYYYIRYLLKGQFRRYKPSKVNTVKKHLTKIFRVGKIIMSKNFEREKCEIKKIKNT